MEAVRSRWEMVKRFIAWLHRITRDTTPKPVEAELDWRKVDLDLLSSLFGMEEAKRHLLNLYQPKEVTPEQVLKDASAVELMCRTYPWRIFEQAVWRRFIRALQLSVGAKTLEEREVARSQVQAYVSVMHLPYELKNEKERIEKSREMMREAQATKF